VRVPRGFLTFAFASAFAFAFACTDEGTPAPGEGDDAAVGAGGLTGEVTCADDSRVDTYVAGLTAEGERGVLTFRIDSSDPAPPAKGGNTWEVSVLDADGNPTGGNLAVTLVMPDHGHGSQVEPEVTYDDETSRFSIVPLYLFMAGVWRIGLELKSDSGEVVDRGTFYFCVEG
jgi:hypothetical protein